MKKWMIIFALFLFPSITPAAEGVAQNDLILALPSSTSSGCNLAHAGIKDKKAFLHFYDEMKEAILKKEKDKLANMVHYPLWVYVQKKRRFTRAPMKTPKDFMAHIKGILIPKVVAVVEEQKMENIFCNYQGVMLGNGEIWLGINNEGELGIKAINNNNGKN